MHKTEDPDKDDSIWPKIRIGMFGCGIVGSGVVKTLEREYDPIKHGLEIELAKICVRDINKERPDYVDKSILTTNPDDILDDPNIDVVVELMGGVSPAGDYLLRALHDGKHVVTANKHLLTLPEAQGKVHSTYLFVAALDKKTNIGFEASVCGGIPVIATVSSLPGTKCVESLVGIVNGTSNYILTEMSKGKSYDRALSEAQDKGFAEADPSFDVNGIDAAQKLALLSTLIFGHCTDLRKIPTSSITGITPDDIAYAGDFGYAVKQIALAKRGEDTEKERLELKVGPTLVSKKSELAGVGGEDNAVILYLNHDGEQEPLILRGKGAGMMPTARSVVEDIVRVAKTPNEARHSSYILFTCFPSEEEVYIGGPNKLSSYLRFTLKDEPNILSKITSCLGEKGISIASLNQNRDYKVDSRIPAAILTHPTTENAIFSALSEIEKMQGVYGALRMDVLD